MIKSLKFTTGYPVDLINEYTKKPTFKDKVIEFSDGINVLFAPNGYGKSTILNAIIASKMKDYIRNIITEESKC